MSQLWGLMFRACGANVTTTFPGWLARTTAIYLMADYIEACIRLLNARSVDYGYDAQGEYQFFVQTSDAAESYITSLALGRLQGSFSSVRLIPDLYFIQQQGYAGLRSVVANNQVPAWVDRKATVVWRGSTTGEGPFVSPAEIPRIRLVHLCQGNPHTDVRIMGVPETIRRWLPADLVAKYVWKEGIIGPRLPMVQFSQFKFTIDIDGYANAWSFLEKLLLGCCVLKVGSNYEQWFYDRIRPWEHFVPVRKDLSDLLEKIEWCLTNDEECENIARNGALLASSLGFDSEMRHTCRQIMKVADVTSAL